MAGFSVIEDFQVEKEEAFLEKARAAAPKLYDRRVEAARYLWKGEWSDSLEGLEEISLRAGDELTLDMGEHVVGYAGFSFGYTGSHPDAPALFVVKFAERLCEYAEETKDYQGWLGKGWIQEELVHVDVVPGEARLPRRFAYRYVKLTVLDTSPKYALTVKEAWADAVSAVRLEDAGQAEFSDELLARMDQVGLCTLRDCMQDVFEDGVKRDRRLWLGDFRLQALTSYSTFGNTELAKRCLYLFGGLTFNEGHLAACLFTEPEEEPDDTYLDDFACLYSAALADYYGATSDVETLKDLYPVALRQLRISLENLEDGLVRDPGDAFTVFMDWGEGLNKHCGGTGALLYCLDFGQKLAGEMGDEQTFEELRKAQEEIREAAREAFYDEELGLFVSGPDRQISWCSQVWMVLGGVLPIEESRKVLARLRERKDAVGIITPYMYHYYIEALIKCGEKETALSEICRYWGGMVRLGADTYWETFDPENPDASPYGSLVANSYCHAWSCSVSYFLRRYFAD